MCPYFSACLCSVTVCLQSIGVSYFLNRHVHTWSVFTYRPQFGTDDIEEQCEHINTQAELADPRSDACWDVSQHCGQSILAAEEPRRSLGRKNDSNISYYRLDFFVPCLTGYSFFVPPAGCGGSWCVARACGQTGSGMWQTGRAGISWGRNFARAWLFGSACLRRRTSPEPRTHSAGWGLSHAWTDSYHTDPEEERQRAQSDLTDVAF